MTMSVNKAKEHCGYEEKPVRNVCGNCAAFASDFVYPTWVNTEQKRKWFDEDGYSKTEKNMRCTDHGFAVKKTAVCRLWRVDGRAA